MNEKLLELVVKNGCRKYGSNAMCSGDCFERCKDCIAPIHIESLVNSLVSEGVFAPPCNVGDVVYHITNGTVEMCEVEAIHIAVRSYIRIKPFYQPWVGNRSVYYKVSISSFGKTVFLTQQAAEKFIKGEKR